MNSTDDTILPLLDRYVTGECSATEVSVVRDWLATNPGEHESVLADVRRCREVAKRRPAIHGVDMAWGRAVQELGIGTQEVAEASDVQTLPLKSRDARVMSATIPRYTLWKGWYPLVGTVLGIAAIVISWGAGVSRLMTHRPTPVLVYTTANGERANITLPDGGSASLNVGSRLEVPADYLAGNRTLRLQGEALFTAPHKSGTPFTVVAGHVTARVLGTSFLVRHYTADTGTTVAVRDGKVAVLSMKMSPIVLTESRQVVINTIGRADVRSVDPMRFSFASGVLQIDGLSWKDAIIELDRWYDADVRLGDSTLAVRRVTGGFTAGSLSDLTAALEWTFNMRVVRDGRILTLFPR